MGRFVVYRCESVMGNEKPKYYEAENMTAVWRHLLRGRYNELRTENFVKYCYKRNYTIREIDPVNLELGDLEYDEVSYLFWYMFTGGEGYQEGTPGKEWSTTTVVEYSEPTFERL